MTNEELEENNGPYGYCPKCGRLGLTRERRPNGDDTCVSGHLYKTSDALKSRPTTTEEQK